MKFRALFCLILISGFLLAGTMMTFVMPPFQVPDENIHWNVANYRLDTVFGGSERVCSALYSLPEDFKLKHLPGYREPRMPTGVQQKLREAEKTTCFDGHEMYGTHFTYPGVLLARGLYDSEEIRSKDAAASFYAARWIQGLIIVLALVFLCLVPAYYGQPVPLGAPIIATFVLSPLFVQQSFAISADVVVNAYAIFLLAVFAGSIRGSRGLTVCFAAASLLVLITRPPLVPMLGAILACLLLEPELFPGAKSWVGSRKGKIKTATIGGLLLFLGVLAALMDRPTTQIQDGTINAPAQLLYLATHPLTGAKILVTGFFDHVDRYELSGPLGWLDFHPSHSTRNPWLILESIALLIELTTLATFRKSLNLSFRRLLWPVILLGSGVLISAMLTSLAVYMSFNDVGYKIVAGMQGRYSFPYLILIIGLAGLVIRRSFGLKSIEPISKVTQRLQSQVVAGIGLLVLSAFGVFRLIISLQADIVARFW